MKNKEEIIKDYPFLDEVKRHLAITWDDDFTNQTVLDYIKDGITHLQDLAGEETIDFNSDLEAKRLLKEYCRYARNYSIEVFDSNFSDDILRFQINHATKDYCKTSNL